MVPEQFIYIGILISLFGILVYVKDTLKGETKPNRMSWFIWMLAPLVAYYLQIKAGAGLSALVVLMAGLGPLLVLFASYRNKDSYWKISKFDIICGIFSIFALVLYATTNNATLSIVFAIISDALAGIPTLVKAWKYPETETGFEYACSVVSSLIGLSVIHTWSFPIYSFGLYFAVFNLTVVLFVYRKKISNLIS